MATVWTLAVEFRTFLRRLRASGSRAASRLRHGAAVAVQLAGAFLWCGLPAGAAAPESARPGGLTSLRQVRELSPAQAGQALSVEVEGVMTLVDQPRHMTFLHDGTASVYLQIAGEHDLRTGDRIRVTGTTRPGRFTPFLHTTRIVTLGTNALPAGPVIDFEVFRAGFLEGERVTLEGRVLNAIPTDDRLRLRLARSGDIVQAWVHRPGELDPAGLVQAQVRVTGICAGVFNEGNEIIDFHLHAASGSDVVVLSRAAGSAAPATPELLRTLQSGPSLAGPELVRCRGRVSLHWPGRFLFIHDGSGSLEVRTEEMPALQAGDEVEVTGYRTVAHRRMVLSEASVKRLGGGTPPPPVPSALEQIHARHSHGDFVTLEAEVAEEDPTSTTAPPHHDAGGVPRSVSLLLRQNGATVPAEFQNAAARMATHSLAPLSLIRISGVLAALPSEAGEPLAYRLLVPDPATIVTVRRAPWWTAKRIVIVLSGGGIALLSGAGWIVGLSQRRRRKAEQAIRRQREQAVRLRDALLELTRLVQSPLAPGLLPRITELVSDTLGGPRVSVWRLEENESTLVCQDLHENGGHSSGGRLAAGSFPNYFAALRDEPLIAVEHAPTDPRTREFADTYLVPNRIQSTLDVPLRFHGRPSGVLCIEQMGSPRRWDVEEQSFAVGVADQLTILREATERLRAEQALREAHSDLEIRVMLRTTELAEARDRAEAADRLKSAFLATMSHELRTPLNSIIGFTGILLQGLVGALSPEQKKQLGMVQNSARHLLSLINDVLDISKIEAGQVEVTLTPFDVRETLQRAVDLVRPLADRKSLRLDLDTTDAPDLWTSDARRVEQILINLLNNAIKFTERGGVRVDCTYRGGMLEFQVVDTGIGIREEDLPSLFKPFRQLDTGLSRQHEGTGLGLAICAGLVRLLNGRIQVSSTFGHGSRFTVVLPPREPGKQ